MRDTMIKILTETFKANWGKDSESVFFESIADALIKAGFSKKMGNQVGNEFGNWLVIESLGQLGTNQYYKCQCKICGEFKNVALSNLSSGKSTKCNSCKTTKVNKETKIVEKEIVFPNEEFLAEWNLQRILSGSKPVDKYNQVIDED